MNHTHATYRAVGIDPGGRTALVCVDVAGAVIRWVGSCAAAPSDSAKRTRAENKAVLRDRVAAAVDAWAPAVVVLEEPVDTLGAYGKGRRMQGQARGTLFTLGQHYGLCLAAVSTGARRVYSYPCADFGGMPGWMARGASTVPRADTLRGMRHLARSIGAPPTLKEDELMALGVLNFHLNRIGSL